MSKEKVKKKDKWGSIRYKQAINIYSTKIKKNRAKGQLRPTARMGLIFQDHSDTKRHLLELFHFRLMANSQLVRVESF